MKRKSTQWRTVTCERTYRGHAIWVEEMYTATPKWQWCIEWPAYGRAATRLSAMRAAERAVDAALEKGDER